MKVIEEFASLFKGYKALERAYWELRFTQEVKQFEGFKNSYDLLTEELLSIREEKAPYYNVFSILGLSHMETKLHTPFIAHFLNPLEEHGQGSLYLNSFLNILNWKLIDSTRIQNIQVYKEYSIGDGQIDILLTFYVEGKRKAIVVENKIYAGDQKDQLKRYFEYISSNITLSDNDIRVIYLTPYGHSPSENSIDTSLKEELMSKEILQLWSYREQINSWLEDSMERTQSSKVKDSIQQYQQIILQL